MVLKGHGQHLQCPPYIVSCRNQTLWPHGINVWHAYVPFSCRIVEQSSLRVGSGAGWIFVIVSQKENCDPFIALDLLVLLPLILQVKDFIGFRSTSGAPVPIESADH